jgi:sigma-E factor negative regulatory protein RseC
MIEETATVMRVDGGLAWVAPLPRDSACGRCSARAGCGTSVLGKLSPGVGLLEVDNPLDVRQGEQVVIGIPDRVLVRASLLAYLVPLVGLVGAALMAAGWGLGEGSRALAALAGLAAGLLLTRRLSLGMHARYRPSLLRRTSPFVNIRFETDTGAIP